MKDVSRRQFLKGALTGIGLEEGERLAALLKDMQDSAMPGSITLDAKSGATLTRSEPQS